MPASISWQRGYYESGRSSGHLTDDGIATLCGLKIPTGYNIELMGGLDGIGECGRCDRVLEKRNRIRELSEKRRDLISRPAEPSLK